MSSSMPVVVAVEGRPAWLPVIGGMFALAALDLIGAMLARSWADHRSTLSLLGGVVVFGLLFVVYGRSLDYAELSTVTIGWVVLVQVGVVAFDASHGVVIPPPRLAAIALILLLQAYVTASDLAG